MRGFVIGATVFLSLFVVENTGDAEVSVFSMTEAHDGSATVFQRTPGETNLDIDLGSGGAVTIWRHRSGGGSVVIRGGRTEER